MADHLKTITNSIRCFGPAPSTKWGVGTNYTMVWGTSKWGEGTEDLAVANVKVLSNSITPTDAYTKQFSKVFGNSISPTFEADFESLRQGIWFYVFPRPTTDADDRDSSVWSQGSNQSTTWTSAAVTSTSWS